MKILYVEDELSKNIPRIISLFSGYMGKEMVRDLKALEEDESGRGGEPEKIKEIVEKTNLIEVEYYFPKVLDKIIHHCERYDLFIVDRNLLEGEYECQEVEKIDPNFNEDLCIEYMKREGDYLLHMLLFTKNADVKRKFYYLTAYSGEQDEIRRSEIIGKLIDLKKFGENNLIEKGNTDDIKKLQHIIENNKILNLQNENMRYLTILRTNINDRAWDDFVGVLKRKDDKNTGVIKDNLTKMRIIYEQILTACSGIIPDMKPNCADQYGKVVLGRQTIEWLYDNGHIDDIIREFCYTVSKIGSMGPHPNGKPTTDTVNALVYSLKDIITWFGGSKGA